MALLVICFIGDDSRGGEDSIAVSGSQYDDLWVVFGAPDSRVLIRRELGIDREIRGPMFSPYDGKLQFAHC